MDSVSLKPITFSRHKLQAFLVCQRRFQLRYLNQLPWPTLPLDQKAEARVARGQQFHQLLERHYLGLSVETATIQDDELRRWWSLFSDNPPKLPPGRLLPEAILTVPVGNHLLSGRFDLLILGEADGEVFADVVDWKTGLAQNEAVLRRDWQTRLYLAILAEGGGALLTNKQGDGGHSLPAERLSITYWYVTEPEQPRTIAYNAQWHQRNWAEIEALVAQIEGMPRHETWPLTTERSHCVYCAYQAYCDRQGAGQEISEIDYLIEESLTEPATHFLTPDLP